MKECCKCKKNGDISYFAKNRKRNYGLQSWCRECKKVNDARYYLTHSFEMREQIKKAKRVRTLVLQDKVYEYLKNHSCIDCGEKDIIVLEFDHLHDKIYSVSDMVRRLYSFEKVLEEIDKCVVRCANCHRRKTAKQFNYRRAVSSTG